MFSTSSALVTSICTFRAIHWRLRHLPRLGCPRYSLPLYLTGRGGCPGQRFEVTELGPDLVRERVRQAVQDHHGLAPGRLGGAGASPGEQSLSEQGVAEPDQRITFPEGGTDLAVGLDGLLVVGLSLVQVAQVQVDVP